MRAQIRKFSFRLSHELILKSKDVILIKDKYISRLVFLDVPSREKEKEIV